MFYEGNSFCHDLLLPEIRARGLHTRAPLQLQVLIGIPVTPEEETKKEGQVSQRTRLFRPRQ